MLKELIWNPSEIKKHLLQSSFLHKIFQEQKGLEWKLFIGKKKALSIYYTFNENIILFS